MRDDVQRPKKIIQDEQLLSSEMMGEIRVLSKRVVNYLVRPYKILRETNMIASEHVHQSTKTKRNEHDRNEIRIPSKGSAGLEQHFQLLRRHLEAPHH
jgi:hypothetical protein